MTYAEMFVEYKRSEAALRERIAGIGELMRKAGDTAELDSLRRRKIMLETELYDLLDVIDDICGYAGCGVRDVCRNA